MAERTLGPGSFANRVESGTPMSQGVLSGQGPSGGISGGNQGLTELAPGGEFEKQAAINQADLEAVWGMAKMVAEPKLKKIQAKAFWNGVSRVSRGETSEQIEKEMPWFTRLFGPNPMVEGANFYDASTASARASQEIMNRMDELSKLSPEQADAAIFDIFDKNSEGFSGGAQMAFNQTFMQTAPQILQSHQAGNFKYQQEQIAAAKLNNMTAQIDLYDSMARQSLNGTISEETLASQRQILMGALAQDPSQTDESYSQTMAAALEISAGRGNVHAYRVFEESGALETMPPEQRIAFERGRSQGERMAQNTFMANPENQLRYAQLNLSRSTTPPQAWVAQAEAFNLSYMQATGSRNGPINIGKVAEGAGEAVLSGRAKQAEADRNLALAEARSSADAFSTGFFSANREDLASQYETARAQQFAVMQAEIEMGGDRVQATARYAANITAMKKHALDMGINLDREQAKLVESAVEIEFKETQVLEAQGLILKAEPGALARATQMASAIKGVNMADIIDGSMRQIDLAIAEQGSKKGMTPDQIQAAQAGTKVNTLVNLIQGSPNTSIPATSLDLHTGAGTAKAAFNAGRNSQEFAQVRPYLEAARSNPTVAAGLREAWGKSVYERLMEVNQRMLTDPTGNPDNAWKADMELSGGVAPTRPTKPEEVVDLIRGAGIPLPEGSSGSLYADRVMSVADRLVRQGRYQSYEEAVQFANLQVSKTMTRAGENLVWDLPEGGKPLSQVIMDSGNAYDDDVAERAVLGSIRNAVGSSGSFPNIGERELSMIEPQHLSITQGPEQKSENGQDTTLYQIQVNAPGSLLEGQTFYIQRQDFIQAYGQEVENKRVNGAGAFQGIVDLIEPNRR